MPLFLKIGDIRGASSAHPSHVGWIELLSASMSGSRDDKHVHQVSVSIEASQEREAVKGLWLACMVGKPFPKAMLAMVSTGRVTFTMLEVLVWSFSTSGGSDGSDIATANVALEFAKSSWASE